MKTITKTTDEALLKPCKCGGMCMRLTSDTDGDGAYYAIVKCHDCGTKSSAYEIGRDKAEITASMRWDCGQYSTAVRF